MTTKYALRGFILCAILAAAAACTSGPSAPRDLLDDRTGSTVSVVGAPIECEHEVEDGSHHDVLTLVAIQEDDDGKYTASLLLYRWAVFFGAAPFGPETGAGELLIDVDGHSIDLHPLPQLPPGLPGPKNLFMPDKTGGAMRAYAIDLDTLRLIAASHQLTVRMPQESPLESYSIWHDGRPALQEFVKHLSAP